MLVWSAVLLIPFRIIAVRKTTQVTDFEGKATLAVTVLGVILSLAACGLFRGIEGLWSRKNSLQRELVMLFVFRRSIIHIFSAA